MTNLTQKANLSQASNLTGLSTRQLKTLIKSGKVTGYRVGHKTYLIDIQSLDQYITRNKIRTKGSVLGSIV